jgi:inner membrane transporter RhtA
MPSAKQVTAPTGHISGFWSGPSGGTAMVTISMFCVQLGVAFSVDLSSRIGPFDTAALRTGCAGALILALVRPHPAAFTRSGLLSCGLLGIVTGGFMVLFMCAVARIPMGSASALEFLGPLGVAICSARDKSKGWVVVAAAGALLLTQPWHGEVNPSGIGFALASGACCAGYILLTRRVGDEITGLHGLAISMPIAGFVAILAAAPSGFGRITWKMLLIGLALATLHPVLPFILEFLAMRKLAIMTFGMLLSLEPAIALVIGLIALHQTLGPAPGCGIALVIIANIGVTPTSGRDVAREITHPHKGISKCLRLPARLRRHSAH